MQKYVPFILFLGAGIIIVLAIFYFLTPAKKSPAPQLVSREAPPTPLPTFPNPTSAPELTIAPQDWTTYTNEPYQYSVSYPSAFKVENRGKIGNNDNVVAIIHQNGTQQITITTLSVSSYKPALRGSQNVVSGIDGNGNFVMSAWFPLPSGKGVILRGAVFPGAGNQYKYDDILKQIISSFQIKK